MVIQVNRVSGSWSSRGASLTAAGRYGRLRSLEKDCSRILADYDAVMI
jgi:hypothetical protein